MIPGKLGEAVSGIAGKLRDRADDAPRLISYGKPKMVTAW